MTPVLVVLTVLAVFTVGFLAWVLCRIAGIAGRMDDLARQADALQSEREALERLRNDIRAWENGR